MIKNQVYVYNVLPGSIAEEAGVEKGDIISSINGEKVIDVFDYRFLIADENLLLEVIKPNGEVWEVDIEKEQYEDLGLEFEDLMIDSAKSCTNKCIFCFIDQLPPNLRDTLYFKDDDSRLSFFMGNYVTLTNMKMEDIDRIIKYRMSPINVSVHTTNPELRAMMLKNRFAGDVLKKIRRLIDNDIEVNGQIVLCRDINDKEHLDRTLDDLTSFYPGVKSISVVPVGLTKYRQGLFELKGFDKEASLGVIKQVNKWQEKLTKKHNSRVVYAADEFYIMAEKLIPAYEEYEDFPQIENGVGLIASLRHEVNEALNILESNKAVTIKTNRLVSIATGVSAYSYIKELCDKIESKFNNIKINVYPIKNEFFGEKVTVTGLLTGRDIFEQIKEKEIGETLLLCKSVLKSGEELFLDDYTLTKLQEDLHVKITTVENSGTDFVFKILGL